MATLILNFNSRRSAAEVEHVQEALAQRGVAVDQVVIAHTGDQVRRYARRAIRGGAKLIIAGGGDGTMTAVVSELAFREVTLGLLPLGTGNSFAQSLGIPLDVEGAADVVAGGRSVQVDLGMVNRTYFANFATIGLAAEIAHQTPRSLKSVLGIIAYVLAGLRPALSQQPFVCELRWERQCTRLATKQLIIASGRVFGNVPLAPDASITDARLSIFTTTGLSHFELARMYATLALGRHAELPDAQHFTAQSVYVRTRPRQRISIDGETWGKTPARFSIAQKALRVLVPSDFAAGA
ncbi:MAG TPA: diacylglycerol kinase family protein [Candidatus Acidoferrales bacterium]|nr:diacylglycerol kinase family protein [Candidatus Acidoferrales bacterium]